MKISFFSNFLNHHQLPFCKEMIKKVGNDFVFIAMEETPKERLSMGYEDMNKKFSFVLPCYASEENKRKALKIAYESDVVILGDAPDIYITERLKANKLTFRFRERIFKNGISHALDPRVIRSMLKNHTKYRYKNLRLLCAGGYVPYDMKLFAAYPNKMYKWGYFPEAKQYDIKRLLEEKEKNMEIYVLWVGRLIKWKHPERAILVAEFLRKQGIKYRLDIIGEGDLEKKLIKLVKEKNLFNNVNFLGTMSPEKVRMYMEKANIYLFTSDFGEGWGAVLNEAMNSGCAVIASHAIGSVPYLLKHMKNGLIYQNGNDEDLCQKVLKICQNRNLRNRLGTNAYKTIISEWCPSKAAENFYNLCTYLLLGKELSIISGPGSIANVISQKKMYRYLTLMRDDEKNEDFK